MVITRGQEAAALEVEAAAAAAAADAGGEFVAGEGTFSVVDKPLFVELGAEIILLPGLCYSHTAVL